MRVVYSIFCLIGIMLYQGETQAYSLDNSLNLNDKQISTDEASYQKMASVSFISRRSNSKTNDVSEGDDLENSPIKKTDCPSGYEKVNGVCTNISACSSAFPLTSANSKIGSYVTKDCGKGNRYCYTSCATGYTRDGCECKPVDCSGFPFSESNGHHCNGVKSCKTGEVFKYKCTSCETGYDLSGSVCNNKACASGYYSSVTSNCAKVDTAKTGEALCYKCLECRQGWTLNTDNYTCTENSCGSGYTTTMISHCVKYASVSKTGPNTCYKCTTCAPGYNLNSTGTSCDAQSSCNSGYEKSHNLYQCTSVSTHLAGTTVCNKCSNCSEYHYLSSNHCYDCTYSYYANWDSCPSNCNCTRSDYCGGHYKYRVDSGKEYYYKSSETGCSKCTWNGYAHMDSCPGGCNCTRSDYCGGHYKYRVDSAQYNYYLNSSGTCSYCSWAYGNESCSSNCYCYSDTCGGHTKYSSPYAATSNHYVSGNSCPACTWGGRTLGSCPSGCNCSSDTCGGTTKYSVSSAKANYYVSGNSCPACTWGGRSLTSCPNGCNCSSDTCGGTTKYSITSAKEYYYQSGNSCPACTWNGYQNKKGCPANCHCANSSTCGGHTYYQITGANSGYYKSSETSCSACTWGGKTLTSCPSNCNCSSESCGGTTKYSISSAKSGYTVSGNSCVAAGPSTAEKCIKAGYLDDSTSYFTSYVTSAGQLTRCPDDPNGIYAKVNDCGNGLIVRTKVCKGSVCAEFCNAADCVSSGKRGLNIQGMCVPNTDLEAAIQWNIDKW